MNTAVLTDEQMFVQRQLVWPIPLQYGIRITEFLKHNLNENNHSEFVKVSSIELPSNLTAYMFQCSELLETEMLVPFHAIHLLHFYLEKYYSLNEKQIKQQQLDPQLVGLTCLLLSSKLFEKCQICTDNVIYLSNYSYTKQDILSTESQILECFDFEIALRDELLIDKTMLYLELVGPLLPENTLALFREATLKIVEVLYEDFLFVKNFSDVPLLASAVIQSGAVLLTKCTGNMPLTMRLSALIKKEQQKILHLSSAILKRVLQKEFLKKYNI